MGFGARETVPPVLFAFYHCSQRIYGYFCFGCRIMSDKSLTVEEKRAQKRLVALERVSKHWEALASSRFSDFRDDEEIALAAIKQEVSALDFVSARLVSDDEFIRKAMKFHWAAIRYGSFQLQGDRSLFLEIARSFPNGIDLVRDCYQRSWRNDREMVMALARYDGSVFREISDELKSDKGVVISAVREFSLIINYVNPGLQEDPDVLLACVRGSKEPAKFYLPVPTIIQQIKSIMLNIQRQESLYSENVNFRGPHSQREENTEYCQKAVIHFAQNVWKRRCLEKAWLLKQSALGGTSLVKEVVGFLGISDEIREADTLIRLAPVFGAYAEAGVDWRHIPLER